MITFDAGDLTRGYINAQLLILPSVGLEVTMTRRPIDNDFMTEGLLRSKLILQLQYTLMPYDFGKLNQGRIRVGGAKWSRRH